MQITVKKSSDELLMFETNFDTAVVIILYNPGNDEINRAISAAEHVGLVILIDNSFSPTCTAENFDKKIRYLHYPENIGIARALNIAFTLAQKANLQFVITLDQDSIFDYSKIYSLKEIFTKHSTAGIVSPRHSNPLYTYKKSPSVVEEVLQVMTSGNLVKISAWQQVNGFDENLFIDYVDVDFCLRLGLAGFHVYINNAILMLHSEGDLELVHFFCKEARIFNYSPFRWYYKTRNFLYLRSKLGSDFPDHMKVERQKFILDFIKLLLFEKHKIRKVSNMANGFYAHCKKNYGRSSRF